MVGFLNVTYSPSHWTRPEIEEFYAFFNVKRFLVEDHNHIMYPYAMAGLKDSGLSDPQPYIEEHFLVSTLMRRIGHERHEAIRKYLESVSCVDIDTEKYDLADLVLRGFFKNMLREAYHNTKEQPYETQLFLIKLAFLANMKTFRKTLEEKYQDFFLNFCSEILKKVSGFNETATATTVAENYDLLLTSPTTRKICKITTRPGIAIWKFRHSNFDNIMIAVAEIKRYKYSTKKNKDMNPSPSSTEVEDDYSGRIHVPVVLHTGGSSHGSHSSTPTSQNLESDEEQITEDAMLHTEYRSGETGSSTPSTDDPAINEERGLGHTEYLSRTKISPSYTSDKLMSHSNNFEDHARNTSGGTGSSTPTLQDLSSEEETIDSAALRCVASAEDTDSDNGSLRCIFKEVDVNTCCHLKNSEKQFLEELLPQLLADVFATFKCSIQFEDVMGVENKAIRYAMGVVGFKVTVVTVVIIGSKHEKDDPRITLSPEGFPYAKINGVDMHTDVFITKQFDLLKKIDREKFVEILLALEVL